MFIPQVVPSVFFSNPLHKQPFTIIPTAGELKVTLKYKRTNIGPFVESRDLLTESTVIEQCLPYHHFSIFNAGLMLSIKLGLFSS